MKTPSGSSLRAPQSVAHTGPDAAQGLRARVSPPGRFGTKGWGDDANELEDWIAARLGTEVKYLAEPWYARLSSDSNLQPFSFKSDQKIKPVCVIPRLEDAVRLLVVRGANNSVDAA